MKNSFENNQFQTENAKIVLDGKYFVLKHVFKNVPDMKEEDEQLSDIEEHFGVQWRMEIKRNIRYLEFNFLCVNPAENWCIETEDEQKLISTSGSEHFEKGNSTFEDGSSWGYHEFIEWDEMEKNYVKDGKLTAEIHAKIKKMTEVYKENLRCFDESMKEVSDVALVVQNQKFYVSKLSLAAHSEYFKTLFLGQL